MILGGLYEALLDNRIVEFVHEKRRNGNLTLDMRCRLLMLVLIGNLDLSLGDDSSDSANARVLLSEDVTSQHETAAAEGILTDDHKEHDEIFLDRLPTTSGSETRVGEVVQRPIASLTTHQRVLSQDRDSAGSSQSFLLPGESAAFRRNTLSTRGNSASPATIPQRRPPIQLAASPWRDMERLLYPIRLFDDDEPGRKMSPRQSARRHHNGICRNSGRCADETHFEIVQPHPRTPMVEEEIRKTKTRLRTMLNCQYSFGSMVGAPVVFFIGGFIFALIQSLQTFGDEDIALALAFGQWYMIIPHIAIISGLLLAGNNPNILEGVAATQQQEQEEEISFLGLRFGLAYPSCYKVAWQWHRGHNKKLWIDKLLDTYLYRACSGDIVVSRDLMQLSTRTSLSFLDWFVVLFMAALLLGVPFFLAFITAFYTPQVGLSCRYVLYLWRMSVIDFSVGFLRSGIKDGPLSFKFEACYIKFCVIGYSATENLGC